MGTSEDHKEASASDGRVGGGKELRGLRSAAEALEFILMPGKLVKDFKQELLPPLWKFPGGLAAVSSDTQLLVSNVSKLIWSRAMRPSTKPSFEGHRPRCPGRQRGVSTAWSFRKDTE